MSALLRFLGFPNLHLHSSGDLLTSRNHIEVKLFCQCGVHFFFFALTDVEQDKNPSKTVNKSHGVFLRYKVFGAKGHIPGGPTALPLVHWSRTPLGQVKQTGVGALNGRRAKLGRAGRVFGQFTTKGLRGRPLVRSSGWRSQGGLQKKVSSYY